MKIMRYVFVAIIGVVLLAVVLGKACSSGTTSSSNSRDDYEGGLVPLQSEIAKVEDYELVAKIILKNLDGIEEARDTQASPSIVSHIMDLQRDSLKLRFRALIRNFDVKVENGDTVVVFNSDHVDYNMTSDTFFGPYTLYKHRIFYTNKPVEVGEYMTMEQTPGTIIKMKDKLYYGIDSHLEY